MIFKSKQAIEEEINRRVVEIEKQNRADRHFFELDEAIHKLTWRMDALEERLNPSKKEEYPTTPCNPR